jgi:SAM-dependent methyltransferase/uncharacterized protein YbaR (Trm112 family)
MPAQTPLPPYVLCPGCRVRHGEQLEVRTLERERDGGDGRDGDARRSGGFGGVGSGVLRCECGRRYPIVDGVPIVMADSSAYLRSEMATVVERELPPEVAALLVAALPDDAPYARLLEHLSIYLDAHWGDRAEPAPDGPIPDPGPSFAAAPLAAKVAERASARVAQAVELGCSTGRIVAELARGADRVVGLDLHLGALRRARRLLAGEPLVYNRRVSGRHYRAATISAGDLAVAAERLTWLCGDALDPPLVPNDYERVVAFNVLDSGRQPRQLLGVVDGLCAPGGEILLSSPYAWQSDVVDEGARMGGADPARDLVELLRAGTDLGARYTIEDEDELTWTLRKDARSAVTYRVHYLRARKGELHA